MGNSPSANVPLTEPVVPTGRYYIVNVKQQTFATLPDPNDGTPISGDANNTTAVARWNVVRLANGKYQLKNEGSANYANAGNRPQVGATVEGRSAPVQWVIQETRVKGQYTIATTDSRTFWGVVDGELGTSVELSATATDQRNWWSFVRA